jgi:cysteine desulfurase
MSRVVADRPSRSRPIYLDGLSTMPLAPEARDAMLAAWDCPGNPGSPHMAGELAAALVEEGRAAVATLIGASPAEIVLTSGATEANNLAITGTALAALRSGSERRHIVVSAIEHKAVIGPALRLREAGFEIELAPATRNGTVDLPALASLIRNDTLLVSLMVANNETGILQPVAAAAKIAHSRGAFIHTDAAQAVGKVPIDAVDLDVDYLSISSHKMRGPAGVGALYVSSVALRPTALIVGGGQEQGLRSGTEPVALVAGFGAAAQSAAQSMSPRAERSRQLLDQFLATLAQHHVHARVNGDNADRLPGAASLTIAGIDAQSLAQRLANNVFISTGSACTSGTIGTSHVLTAMGFSVHEARATFRLFFGDHIEEAEALIAAELIAKAIGHAA